MVPNRVRHHIFDCFASKNEEFQSKQLITKNGNTLLRHQIIQLERNAVNNTQYYRRECIEVNPVVPRDIGDKVLEESACKAISLSGNEVVAPNDLHACYQLKNKDRVILRFKEKKSKQSIQITRNVFQQKSLELSQLKFSGKLIISKNMCYKNQHLDFKYHQLKNSKRFIIQPVSGIMW